MELNNVEFLQSLLGKPAGEISKALKTEEGEPKSLEDALKWLSSQLEPAVKDRIDTAKSNGKEEGYKRAEREILSKKEKDLIDKYGLEEVDKGDLASVVDAAIKKHSKAKATDPEQIRNSETYLEDLKKAKKRAKEVEEEFDQFKSQVRTEKVESKLHSFVDSKLDGFDLPENEQVRKNQINAFLLQMKNKYSWDLNDEGDLVALDQNGNPVRNDIQDEMDTDSVVKTELSGYFIKKEGDDRKGTGAKTDPPRGGNGTPAGPKYNSREEYMQAMDSETDVEKVKALRDEMKTQEEAGKLD